MLNFTNIKQQAKQYEKETYIANKITKRLLYENCTQQEYRDILKIVEEKVLGKGLYEKLEVE
ncbi:hypothetical protein [uncultured Eubacterium sp.]|uniref:hypothetical protein n=1 Tax=uncultured Eubacterium sp. TaxID=165185 RepID=UPI00259A8660|nr:hypothetical protein [uncultured Eubacterium sp.]